MVFKIVSAFAALVAMANAGFIPASGPVYAAPSAYAHAAPLAYAAPAAYAHPPPVAYAAPVAKAVLTKTIDADYDPNPQYSYGYDVHDTLTGDAKSQQETRNGDVVQGSYSLIEADGSRRVVHYTADDQNGFNAVVEKQPAQVAVKAVAPVAYAAPAYAHAAPLSYSAPLYNH